MDGFSLNNGRRECMAQPVSGVIDGLSVLRGGVFGYRDLIPNQIQTDFYFCRHFVRGLLRLLREERSPIVVLLYCIMY